MELYLSKIYDQIKSGIFKESIFKEYHELYNKGAYKEAYTVLRDIVARNPKWSKKGDPYVTFAKLEVLANNDTDAALKFLEKAKKLGCSDMATYYSILGYVFFNKDDFEKGIQYLEKSVEEEPNLINLSYLGKVLSSENDKRAVGIWKRILKKYPEDYKAHAYLAMEAEKAGDKEKALLMFKNAEELTRRNDDIYELGRTYYRFKKFQKALEFLLKCEEIDYKTQDDLFGRIAYCYLYLGDYESAILYAAKAIDINFNDDHVKDILLYCTMRKEIILDIDKIVRINPETPVSFIVKAQEAFKRKNHLIAHEMLTKAERLNPSSIEMYYISHLYYDLGDIKNALNLLFDIERKGFNHNGRLYYSIADCYLRLGNFESAILYAVKALDINFNDDYAKDVLLYCSEEVKDISVFNSLIEKYPETCFSYVLISRKEIKLKKFSNAREIIIKAEQLNPTPIEMYHIAYIYYDLIDIGNSLDRLLKAEKIGFDDQGRLYYSIADCYYWLDDFDQSIQYALKVLSMEPDNEFAREVIYACREEMWGDELGDNY